MPRVSLAVTGHEPYPAITVDRAWALVAHNRAAGTLMTGLPEHLLAPPMNVLRASLHPEGLAPRIVNLAQWKAHILERLGRQVQLTGDPALRSLYEELDGYPAPPGDPGPASDVAVPLRLRTPDGELRFISTVTTFGTPADITVEELSIESFFPADRETAEYLRRGGGNPGPRG